MWTTLDQLEIGLYAYVCVYVCVFLSPNSYSVVYRNFSAQVFW